MSDADVRAIVLGVIQSKTSLQDLSGDQDFFDAGVSSLTVIDMQLQIEEKLGVSVPTSHLMANPMINGWVLAYTEAKSAVKVAAVG
jgi:D-alanine--poly(phosphoribitol) ligase subunit 2